MTEHYPEDFVERLHLVWGTGFLSPGGPEEVAEIVQGLDLNGALVLDIGCGTGGPAIVLARDRGARVVGIDIEKELITRASRLARDAGVEKAIDFRAVEPGPLPFADASFDVVFSKDALIHVHDKEALYAEVRRVLKPGGVFAASDWLSGEQTDDDEAFQAFLERTRLRFAMATAPDTAEVMRQAGFVDVATVDRNPWYAEVCAREVTAIEGPLRDEIIKVSSEAVYDDWLAIRRGLAAATKSGGLRPTHLRGRRPF